MARQDPLRNFRFRLEIDQIVQAGFSEVTIGDSTVEPIEYRDGNDPETTVRKNKGLTKYGNITLKWGITNSMDLSEWHRQVIGDTLLTDNLRRTVLIHVQNEAGEDKATFEIVNAWPTKYDPTDLNGKGNEVAIETLELVNEGMRRIL